MMNRIGRGVQKYGTTGDPHHIMATPYPRSPKYIQPPLSLQNIRGTVLCRARDMPCLGYTSNIIVSIPDKGKVGHLDKLHQGVSNLNTS